MSPRLPISPLEASSTFSASVCRSRMIASTVIEPMIERRCPEKICPVSSSICAWLSRKRWAAAAMLGGGADLERDHRRDPQRDALLGDAVLVDHRFAQGQRQERGLAEDGEHEGAVPDDDPERQDVAVGGALLPAGDEHGLAGSRHAVAEHGSSSLPKTRFR